MKSLWIKNILRLLLLMAIQLLILNNVYLSSYVLPMIYVLFVLMLPTSLNRILLLIIAFAVGLSMDIACNALGFHALACTIVAMVRIWFADRILTRSQPIVIESPTIFNTSVQYYIGYLLTTLSIFFFVYFLTEALTFRGFLYTIIATIASTLVTAVLVIIYQAIFTNKSSS